jgi:N6-adenosine-specific RNA methylase IME4
MIDEQHYPGFRDDVAARGLQQPLEITPAGVLLDGRARLRVARELGLAQVPVSVVSPAEEVEYMILAALQRRQLSAAQRAALVVERDCYRAAREQAAQRRLANLRGVEVGRLPPRGKTRELAAGWAGVSARTVEDVALVQRHDPALFAQVKAGRLGGALAARRVRSALRDRELTPPPLPQGPFQLLYADPPWQLGNPDSAHAPENHYPTMPLAEICALRPPTAEDALLLLWAVNCLLPEALQVIEAWGFEYKTNLVWVKPRIGLGYWARNRHELLLLGTRGRFPLPDPADRPDSVLQAPRGRHSQKPDRFYQLIEQAWPQATKLELFARRARPGWAAWGNQTPAAATG